MMYRFPGNSFGYFPYPQHFAYNSSFQQNGAPSNLRMSSPPTLPPMSPPSCPSGETFPRPYSSSTPYVSQDPTLYRQSDGNANPQGISGPVEWRHPAFSQWRFAHGMPSYGMPVGFPYGMASGPGQGVPGEPGHCKPGEATRKMPDGSSQGIPSASLGVPTSFSSTEPVTNKAGDTSQALDAGSANGLSSRAPVDNVAGTSSSKNSSCSTSGSDTFTDTGSSCGKSAVSPSGMPAYSVHTVQGEPQFATVSSCHNMESPQSGPYQSAQTGLSHTMYRGQFGAMPPQWWRAPLPGGPSHMQKNCQNVVGLNQPSPMPNKPENPNELLQSGAVQADLKSVVGQGQPGRPYHQGLMEQGMCDKITLDSVQSSSKDPSNSVSNSLSTGSLPPDSLQDKSQTADKQGPGSDSKRDSCKAAVETVAHASALDIIPKPFGQRPPGAVLNNSEKPNEQDSTQKSVEQGHHSTAQDNARKLLGLSSHTVDSAHISEEEEPDKLVQDNSCKPVEQGRQNSAQTTSQSPEAQNGGNQMHVCLDGSETQTLPCGTGVTSLGSSKVQDPRAQISAVESSKLDQVSHNNQLEAHHRKAVSVDCPQAELHASRLWSDSTCDTSRQGFRYPEKRSSSFSSPGSGMSVDGGNQSSALSSLYHFVSNVDPTARTPTPTSRNSTPVPVSTPSTPNTGPSPGIGLKEEEGTGLTDTDNVRLQQQEPSSAPNSWSASADESGLDSAAPPPASVLHATVVSRGCNKSQSAAEEVVSSNQQRRNSVSSLPGCDKDNKSKSDTIEELNINKCDSPVSLSPSQTRSQDVIKQVRKGREKNKSNPDMPMSSSNTVSSVVFGRLGKQSRMKRLGLNMQRTRRLSESSVTSPPVTPTPCAGYTFTFHVPTPVYKRFKMCAVFSKRASEDIKIVRMHPMDARRYSLLKIGRELVRVKCLSEGELPNKRANSVVMAGSNLCDEKDLPKDTCTSDFRVSSPAAKGESGSDIQALCQGETARQNSAGRPWGPKCSRAHKTAQGSSGTSQTIGGSQTSETSFDACATGKHGIENETKDGSDSDLQSAQHAVKVSSVTSSTSNNSYKDRVPVDGIGKDGQTWRTLDRDRIPSVKVDYPALASSTSEQWPSGGGAGAGYWGQGVGTNNTFRPWGNHLQNGGHPPFWNPSGQFSNYSPMMQQSVSNQYQSNTWSGNSSVVSSACSSGVQSSASTSQSPTSVSCSTSASYRNMGVSSYHHPLAPNYQMYGFGPYHQQPAFPPGHHGYGPSISGHPGFAYQQALPQHGYYSGHSLGQQQQQEQSQQTPQQQHPQQQKQQDVQGQDQQDQQQQLKQGKAEGQTQQQQIEKQQQQGIMQARSQQNVELQNQKESSQAQIQQIQQHPDRNELVQSHQQQEQNQQNQMLQQGQSHISEQQNRGENEQNKLQQKEQQQIPEQQTESQKISQQQERSLQDSQQQGLNQNIQQQGLTQALQQQGVNQNLQQQGLSNNLQQQQLSEIPQQLGQSQISGQHGLSQQKGLNQNPQPEGRDQTTKLQTLSQQGPHVLSQISQHQEQKQENKQHVNGQKEESQENQQEPKQQNVQQQQRQSDQKSQQQGQGKQNFQQEEQCKQNPQQEKPNQQTLQSQQNSLMQQGSGLGEGQHLCDQQRSQKGMQGQIQQAQQQHTLQGQHQHQGMQGQYQHPGMQGQYRHPGVQGQYQHSGVQGQYQHPGMHGRYHHPGMQGQYPHPGMHGQYQQRGMHGQYPQQGMHGQYRLQGPYYQGAQGQYQQGMPQHYHQGGVQGWCGPNLYQQGAQGQQQKNVPAKRQGGWGPYPQGDLHQRGNQGQYQYGRPQGQYISSSNLSTFQQNWGYPPQGPTSAASQAPQFFAGSHHSQSVSAGAPGQISSQSQPHQQGHFFPTHEQHGQYVHQNQSSGHPGQFSATNCLSTSTSCSGQAGQSSAGQQNQLFACTNLDGRHTSQVKQHDRNSPSGQRENCVSLNEKELEYLPKDQHSDQTPGHSDLSHSSQESSMGQTTGSSEDGSCSGISKSEVSQSRTTSAAAGEPAAKKARKVQGAGQSCGNVHEKNMKVLERNAKAKLRNKKKIQQSPKKPSKPRNSDAKNVGSDEGMGESCSERDQTKCKSRYKTTSESLDKKQKLLNSKSSPNSRAVRRSSVQLWSDGDSDSGKDTGEESEESSDDFRPSSNLRSKGLKRKCSKQSESQTKRTKRSSVNYNAHAFSKYLGQGGEKRPHRVRHLSGQKDRKARTKVKGSSLIEGVHYIVVGKFKGHRVMLVKVDRVKVKVDEVVKVSEWKKGLDQPNKPISQGTDSENVAEDGAINKTGFAQDAAKCAQSVGDDSDASTVVDEDLKVQTRSAKKLKTGSRSLESEKTRSGMRQAIKRDVCDTHVKSDSSQEHSIESEKYQQVTGSGEFACEEENNLEKFLCKTVESEANVDLGVQGTKTGQLAKANLCCDEKQNAVHNSINETSDGAEYTLNDTLTSGNAYIKAEITQFSQLQNNCNKSQSELLPDLQLSNKDSCIADTSDKEAVDSLGVKKVDTNSKLALVEATSCTQSPIPKSAKVLNDSLHLVCELSGCR